MLFIFLLTVQTTLAQTTLMQQANDAYLRGDFPAAIALYEDLVASGSRHPALFFNLGSAYYENGDFAHALLYYRRAQAIIPRDSQLNTNMALIRARRIDIQNDQRVLIDSFAELTSDTVTLRELGGLVTILWLGWFALLMWRIYQPEKRDRLRIPLWVIGSVLAAVVLLFSTRFYVTAERPAAVVIRDNTPVMSGPSSDYFEMYELHAATEIRILEIRDNWARFVLPDGRPGWITQDSFEEVDF